MQNIQTLFSVTEVELTYRNKVPAAERHLIKTSQAAYDLLLNVWDLNKIELVEQVNLLLLDHGNRCLGISRVATGGVGSCIVDPKIVFATALRAKATGIILAHNHPSGTLKPSDPDINLTDKLYKGANLLDIRLLDHLIMTRRGYFSFGDEGLIL